MKKLSFILSLFLFVSLKAQHMPINTQYMYQGLLINPAITGSRNDLLLSFTHRNQYLGNANTPRTNIFSAHSPIKKEAISLGIQVYQQSFNRLNNIGLSGFGAYRIKISKTGKLALGIKAGLLSSSFNWGDVQTIAPGDPNFQDIQQDMTPQLGFGTYYRSHKFYAGIAVPEMINSYNGLELGYTNWNTTVLAGYIFDISEKISLIPNVLIRRIGNQKPQTDLTLLLRFNKKIDLGAIVRSGGKILGMSFDINITNQIQLGYSFDTGIANNKVLNTYGNHEVSISYGFKKIVKTYNTRFF